MDGIKTGLEILKDPYSTAGEIADILGKGHPPFPPGTQVQCDNVSCRDCWLAWLTTGEPPVAADKPARVPAEKKIRL